MKKNIFAIAAAAIMAFGMTACETEVVTPDNFVTPNSNARVKTTEDLHNTDWTFTMTYTEFINNMLGLNIPCMDSINDETYEFGLNFDGTYAHFTFPENIEAYSADSTSMQQIYGVSYTYAYDGSTHTGYLDGVADGEEDPGQLQFTYDDATDVITIVLTMFYVDDNTPVTLTLNFARNE